MFSCPSIQLVGSNPSSEPELVSFICGEEESSLPFTSCLWGEQKPALFQERRERLEYNLEGEQCYGDATSFRADTFPSSHTDQLVATED